jgi:hypothetical protein
LTSLNAHYVLHNSKLHSNSVIIVILDTKKPFCKTLYISKFYLHTSEHLIINQNLTCLLPTLSQYIKRWKDSLMLSLNFKTLEEALHKTPFLFKVNVICICKKAASFISILPSFMYIFVLSHLTVPLVWAETFNKLM